MGHPLSLELRQHVPQINRIRPILLFKLSSYFLARAYRVSEVPTKRNSEWCLLLDAFALCRSPQPTKDIAVDRMAYGHAGVV